MRKLGMPDGVIQHKLMMDGVTLDILRFVFAFLTLPLMNADEREIDDGIGFSLAFVPPLQHGSRRPVAECWCWGCASF